MTEREQSKSPEPKRGILARPLDALVFLLPLIAFYEITSLARPDRVIAYDAVRRFFDLFGRAGTWAPGLGIIAILLATHLSSGEKWSVHWRKVGLLYVEAMALAVPLLGLNWAVPLGPATAATPMLVDRIAQGVGAGVYEELVFRLILISVIMMIGVDVLRCGRTSVALVAVILSSLAFAAHHHQPVGMEPFELTRFAFRTIAGAYLAIVFWYRGYGSAAGCHAAYNVALVVVGIGDT